MSELVAFILTHGRPKNVKTYKSLEKAGFTGRVYIVIDNEDSTAKEYKELYGDKVIMFDKLAISRTFDTADNFSDRRSIVYARNACFQIAKQMGIRYFIQLDDDYKQFVYKFDENLEYKERPIHNLNKILGYMLDYYKSIPAATIALAQNGDFIGGGKSGFAKTITPKRKAMNSFICDTEREFQFLGRVNEDVNTYTYLGSKGHLFLTIPPVSLIQMQTQQNKGGMTELYLSSGTYLKSFYTVMFCPSAVKISEMGDKNLRLHHKIIWDSCVPKILRQEKRDAEQSWTH